MTTLLENAPVVPEGSLKEQLIAEVLGLGIRAHQRTEHCVFVEFHGHVDLLSISVRNNSEDYQTELASSIIRLKPYPFYNQVQKETFERDTITKLVAIKTALETYLAQKPESLELFLHQAPQDL